MYVVFGLMIPNDWGVRSKARKQQQDYQGSFTESRDFVCLLLGSQAIITLLEYINQWVDTRNTFALVQHEYLTFISLSVKIKLRAYILTVCNE